MGGIIIRLNDIDFFFSQGNDTDIDRLAQRLLKMYEDIDRLAQRLAMRVWVRQKVFRRLLNIT